MPLTFPTSPTNGQTTTLSGTTYTYNATKGVWEATASGGGFVAGSFSEHILPSADDTYDIGSASNKIRDLYVSDNSLHIGDHTMSADSEGINIPTLKLGTGSNRVKLMANSEGKLRQIRTVGGVAQAEEGISSDAGTTTVDTFAELQAAPVVAGKTVLVKNTNKLYINTGTGWYVVGQVTNESPTAITGLDATYSLATDGTATVITMNSTDPEGFPLTWSHAVTTGTLGSTATITNVDNVFTITPSTTEADAGSFSVTFSASDGSQAATSVSDFSLSFYTQGSSLFGRWDMGNSSSYSGTGTTWNDLSGNGRNLTIQNGAYNSSGINGSTAVWDWTTQNSARIDFPTDISSVKTFIVIWGFTSTTPNTRLMILNGNGTGNYAGFTDANDVGNNVPGGDGSYAGITPHAGETIVTTMNGNSVTGPAVLYNGMQQGYLNLFALRGAKFTDSTVKYANYGGYNHPHQLRAILMWDVMLTDSEIKDVYDTFPSSAMATWDG